jgi:hypothetical protein
LDILRRGRIAERSELTGEGHPFFDRVGAVATQVVSRINERYRIICAIASRLSAGMGWRREDSAAAVRCGQPRAQDGPWGGRFAEKYQQPHKFGDHSLGSDLGGSRSNDTSGPAPGVDVCDSV